VESASVSLPVCVWARSWLCGCMGERVNGLVGVWVNVNTKSQWIRLANWKINSVAVAGIDKEKYRELEKLLHAAFLLCVSLSSLRLCLYSHTHTHWQAFYLLMISHFAYGISLLLVLFVLLCLHRHTDAHKLLTDVVVDFPPFPPLGKRRKLSKKRKDLFRFDQN